MELTENMLVVDFGFKRRQKNKSKFLHHPDYDITLTKKGNYANVFVDQNGKTYQSNTDIIKIRAIKEIEIASEKIKAGLPKRNLRQGNFDEVYRESNHPEEWFIDKETAYKLLKANFNWLISRALMTSGQGDNYDYQILSAKCNYRTSGKNNQIQVLTLTYEYKDRRGHHHFWNTTDILSPINKFPINTRVGVYVPIKFIIKKLYTE
jgi:hypothetical protein